MRIFLHIGPDPALAEALHRQLQHHRDRLAERGVLVPPDPEGMLGRRLGHAVRNRGAVGKTGDLTVSPSRPGAATECDDPIAEVKRRVKETAPRVLILMAGALGRTLCRDQDRERLRALLASISQDIRIVAHVDDPAVMLARHYGRQVLEGRATSLDRDLALGKHPDWWSACLDEIQERHPKGGDTDDIEAPPFWLDRAALLRFWTDGFGGDAIDFHSLSGATATMADVSAGLNRCFALSLRAHPQPGPALLPEPSAAWIARARQFNCLLRKLLATGRRTVPRALWRALLDEMRVDGPAIDPDSLRPDLPHLCDKTDASQKRWREADPRFGFRASQYLLAGMYRIDKATREARRAVPAPAPDRAAAQAGPSPAARAILPPLALEHFARLQNSPFAPHDRIGPRNGHVAVTAFEPAAPRALPRGSTGRVIVACMKNEAPYIVEWIAYHRAIGIDSFLIYSNDCTDPTTDLLDRLQELGVLQHRRNDSWKGKSPQQHALNQALKDPVIQHADWIIHIDVDEFINVRTGNGTLDDFLLLVPDATNVAMTWRLFGHNGVHAISDGLVIEQFDTCAPSYCPKPHTAWGFKTMFRNLGAYGKLSCHRPNKLNDAMRGQVKWVNGSGQDMTPEVLDNGWRNSRKSIGYDLLQLNHYALRSADGFLVKRQRGRALHVDREIGLNYWIRMDWSDVRDLSIQRNVPRVRAEYDRLLGDSRLNRLHRAGLDWHRQTAAELRRSEDFRALYEQATQIRLTGTERAAYALALDHDS